MELSKQVVSLEFAKRLKELKVKQESLWYWVELQDFSKRISTVLWVRDSAFGPLPKGIGKRIGVYSAFTSSELGELLPDYFYALRDKGCFPNKWICDSIDTIGGSLIDEKFKNVVSKSAKTEADCKAKMLIYLTENNLLSD